MRTIFLWLLLSIFSVIALRTQILPINHDMKNLKVGNIFIYHYRSTNVKTFEVNERYSAERIIRQDTIDNRIYAVFQNGVRERADSSGVYWIPLSFDTNNPFVKEYLRYPLFPVPVDKFALLFCNSTNFMSSSCFPENHPIYKPVSATVSQSIDTNYNVLGFTVRNFSLLGAGITQYATILGPWNHRLVVVDYNYLTTLCGALIEGKYYGDSACLVASSTPLQGAEYTALTPSLAPNPVSDIATLRFVLPTAQGLTIETYDMLGREVAPPLHFEALSSGMNAQPIEMASLPRGVYAVRLRTALGLRATTMMVKE